MAEEDHLRKSCFYYEMFMERAYGSYVSQKPILQASGMRNLIMAEKGITISLESVAHFEEQLQEIKKHITQALISYMTMPHVSREHFEVLKDYKAQVVWAASSAELIKILHDTVHLTNIIHNS